MFHEHEVENVEKPMNPGLLMEFLKKLAYFQKLEEKKKNKRK